MFLFCVLRIAEMLLPGSKFHRYIRDGQTEVRSSAPYSVPDDVHQYFDFGQNLFYSCKIFSRPLCLMYFYGKICNDITFVFVLPQLEDFIASLLRGSRTSAKPLLIGRKISLRQEYTWE